MSRSSIIVASLKRKGFDKSRSSNGSARVGCSQCEALVINGTACHETGCPNANTGRRSRLVGCGDFEP